MVRVRIQIQASGEAGITWEIKHLAHQRLVSVQMYVVYIEPFLRVLTAYIEPFLRVLTAIHCDRG